MTDNLFDWGFLSVTDVLGTDIFSKDVLPHKTVNILDVELSLLPCEPIYAKRYAQALIKNFKYSTEHNTSTFEELDSFRSIRLKLSLTASQLIQEKLFGAIESFALTVQQDICEPSVLPTLVHIGLLVCQDAWWFCNALIESTEVMASKSSYTQWEVCSFVNVLKLFRLQMNDALVLRKEQRRRFFFAEFSLALRSGKLSAIVSCLLQKINKDDLQGVYSPPFFEPRVIFVRAKTDSFLTRVCELPFHVYTTQIHCFSENERLVVCSTDQVCVFDQVGMMGTRFKIRENLELSVESNWSIIFCDGKELLVYHRLLSSVDTSCYILHKYNCASGKKLAASKIFFHFSDCSTATRDVLFDMCGTTLSCLVLSKALRMSNSKCFLFQKDINSIFLTDKTDFYTASENTLRRSPGSQQHVKRKCYYFTNDNSISIGRVTLKEEFHPFTLEMWVYPCNAHDNQIVLSLGDKNVDEILIEIEPTSEGVLLRGGSRTPHLGASFVTFVVSGKLTFCRRWWHIALIFTGTSWNLWVDDAIVACAPAFVSPEAMTDIECVLGKSFVGCLAEVRIWNCCRTAALLARDSRRSLPTIEPAILGYYPLDEGEGNVIADYSHGGFHAFLHFGKATWLSVDNFPVTPLSVARCIDEFAPIAWCEESGAIFFSSFPGYVALSVQTEGPSLTICEYTTYDLRLIFQARVELPSRTLLKGVTYNTSRHSLVCYALKTERTKNLLIWELHQQHYFPFLKKGTYNSVWECERDLLTQCATYAKRLVGAERCLVDQLSWVVRVPSLVVDASDGLLADLLLFICTVLFEQKDYTYARELCALLHANLLCRVECNREGLKKEIGDLFPDAQSLIKAAQECNDSPSARTELLRLSFQESFIETGLLSMTCRCLLSEKSRLAFIKNQAGRGRITEKEDMLFSCLLQYYASLQASSLLLENTENAQLFCTSLMGEEMFQVDRWLGGYDKALAAIRRTTHSLEVFQEILLAKVVEKSQGDCGVFVTLYAKLLLRLCEKIMESSSKILRKNPDIYSAGLSSCMETSAVGSLLPSFTVALPLLPTTVQASCVSSLKGCREALFLLTDALPRNERLPYELGVALTLALCRIGCSLLVSLDVVTPPVESKYFQLFWGGACKPGCERDAIIKNVQQGVGSISRVIDELHREDAGALLVFRDENLMKLERLLMAAFCALLLPTDSLRQATKKTLAPIFRHVRNLRAWLFSKRQESPELLDNLEERLRFLARFEPVCGTKTEALPRIKSFTRDVSSQRKWRRFFQCWKALRALKTKLLHHREEEAGELDAVVVQFLQDTSIDRDTVDRLVIQHTQKAQYRLSGMQLLRQLVEEARVSDTLAGIVLPVITKTFTGWHYANDVQCCSKEEFFRLHGVFFQLLELVVSSAKSKECSIWSDALLSLLMSELRVIDFRRIRGGVAETLCSLWRYEKQKVIGMPRLNGNIPENIRNTVLSASGAAPTLVVSRSGYTMKGLGGRGTCVASCEWPLGRKDVSYYFEVLIVDICLGGSCSIGLGPSDYCVSRLPGWDSESYALQSDEGTLHEGNALGRQVGCTFTIGDVMGCGWNTDTGELYWTKNGREVVALVPQVMQNQLHPLIGLCGKGLIKVNFGAERFVFEKVPGMKLPKRGLAENAWDVFRAFSLRAVLSLLESKSGSVAQGSNLLDGVRSVVEQCIDCCRAEIDRTLYMFGSDVFVTFLCSHLTTLAKVLVSAKDDALTPCVQRVIVVLQRGFHYAFRISSCSSKLRCALITTWYSFMNLVDPQAITEDEKLPGFLDTLLALGKEIEYALLRRFSEANFISCTAIEAWTAIALLQKINADSPPHRWREKLHAWIIESLGGSVDKVNTSLALRILFGSPRLVVPGDHVTVQKSKHTKITAILVNYSLEDETCEIIEDEERRQTVSLRHTEMTVGGDKATFPQKDNKFHEEQINEVLRLAQQLCTENGVDGGIAGSSRCCSILAILWRCVQKGLIAIPKKILFFLAKLCDSDEVFSEGQDVLVQEKLIIEYCFFGKVFLGGGCGNNGSFAGQTWGQPENEISRESRTRLAQELSMRGYNLDLCFLALDETNNDVQTAVRLLGDHHGDFMSARRRETSSSSDEDEISSDGGEIDTAEYDLVLFPAESDDAVDEDASIDNCDPLSDGIRFFGGYACITSERSLGQRFTIDMQLYLFDITTTQVVFYQKFTAVEWQLVARVQGSSFYCGWVNANGSLPSQLCSFPIENTDTLRWMQLTVVQDTSTFSLFKSGVLQSEVRFVCEWGLLDNMLCIGGCPENEYARFNGGIRDIRMFAAALTEEEVNYLTTKKLLECVHQFIVLDCTSDVIRAVSTDPLLKATVSVSGAVSWFEQSGGGGRTNDFCQQEVDFTTQNGDDGIFLVDTVNDACGFNTIWRRWKDQREEQLLAGILKLDKQLACYYAVAILIHMLRYSPDLGVFLLREQVRSMVRLIVNSLDTELCTSLSTTLNYLAVGDNVSTVNYALEELVEMTQREQNMLCFESPHPFNSASETAHEVYVPGRRAYELHFDARCSTSMLVTFYADHTLSSIIAQTAGYALHSLLIRATRFFFDVRIDTSSPQWGYRIVVLYDVSVPRIAAQLLRSTLSAVIPRGLSRVQFLKKSACLEGMAIASRVSVGATRRLILSCLTDIFLHAAKHAEPMPHVERMYDLRRMAERLFRRTLLSRHLQSRFVQVVAEFYVALKDAEHCWRNVRDGESRVCGEVVCDSATDVELFFEKRVKQRNLYKRREGMRVNIKKVSHPEALRVGVNPNKTVMAWSGRSGSSVVADTPLGLGRWYFEVRMMGSGDVFIGVIPSTLREWTDGAYNREAFVAFNGKTGVFYGLKDVAPAPRRIWKSKDYVGVVMDNVQKVCSFFLNGQDSGISFCFATNNAGAVSAAGADMRNEDEVSYYPFFVLDDEEGITINFGGTHFEYEAPRNCFPFDPANLTLGTLIPYNQLRAFHDLATYILSAGKTKMPTFFHEEANPFDGSVERFGPPHVSLHSSTGVQINLLLARNTGTRFATVKANCRVLGGRWYYEVTLRSQGLIQIGWCSFDESQTGSVGDTSTSWSVDLFRRLKWHDGKCEPLTASRRWVVGDVIGCALDLMELKMIFMCNGRLLCDVTMSDCTFANLPTTLAYVPAVSLRAGNEVMFNFGSSNLKYKPVGFNALGVPDSWNERIDAFYSTLQPCTTLARLQTLRDMWLTADQLVLQDKLRLYHVVLDTVQEYCRRENKSFAQITEKVCVELFRDLSISAAKAWEVYMVLVAFSRVTQTVISFINFDAQHPNISTKLFLACRCFLFASLRHEMVDDILRVTNIRAEHLRVSINRLRSRVNKNAWISSVFGQTFSLMADQHPRIFRTNKRFWSVVFLGEGSEDVGGPFREHIGEMCRELMSSSLPFFVPTANNVHNTGTYRDAFIPAFSATSETELAAFVFVGRLMGGAMRCGEPLSLFFPPLIWKFLCFYPITEADLDDIDRICLQCIREFRTLKSHVGSSDMFDDVFDSETFTTCLSDGTVKELVPGGGAIPVTLERCEEYANALSAARLSECTRQLEKIREGMLSVVPESVLCLLTPRELEFRVCGKPDYTVEELRDGAVYEGLTSDDRRVQYLWQALEEATPVQRRLFLRFVSGRDRLPVKLRVLPLSTSGDVDALLPRAATCFFAIEIPDYSSLEVMKAKLYYSIENCADIDTDFNPREVDQNELPQLIVGMEDALQEEVDSATLSD